MTISRCCYVYKYILYTNTFIRCGDRAYCLFAVAHSGSFVLEKKLGISSAWQIWTFRRNHLNTFMYVRVYTTGYFYLYIPHRLCERLCRTVSMRSLTFILFTYSKRIRLQSIFHSTRNCTQGGVCYDMRLRYDDEFYIGNDLTIIIQIWICATKAKFYWMTHLLCGNRRSYLVCLHIVDMFAISENSRWHRIYYLYSCSCHTFVLCARI